MSLQIAPSVLSADFGRLAEEVKALETAGADLIHIDVMDGHFVPNITIGPVVVKDIKPHTRLPLDVHLMIENAQNFIDSFILAGSDMITLHVEAMELAVLRAQALRLKEKNIKAGISLNPATPLEKIKPVLDVFDFVLVMTVNPGFGAQAFMPEVVPKISALRRIFKGLISVDGGINDVNAVTVAQAGADILVAGAYIFKSKNYNETIRRLKCAK